MPIAISRALSTPFISYEEHDSIPSAEMGKIYQDMDGDLYVIVETRQSSYGKPARVRTGHLDLDCTVAWPLVRAPSGTSITIANED